MKLLADEHVPQAVITSLRSEGVDAISIYDTDLLGVDDQPLLEYATEHDYLILTNDQDFVSEGFPESYDHPGILFYEINGFHALTSFGPSTMLSASSGRRGSPK